MCQIVHECLDAVRMYLSRNAKFAEPLGRYFGCLCVRFHVRDGIENQLIHECVLHSKKVFMSLVGGQHRAK